MALPPDSPAPSDTAPPDTEPPAVTRAGIAQVAATLFWGMVMIGRRGTWEKDGATVTMGQMIVGAVIAGIVVVSLLVTLAMLAVHK
jgi:hypothetical protein